MKKKFVMVAMSGGVDSSVAAALLRAQGFRVAGVHLRCYNADGCAEQDAHDARRAAEALGIPFYVLNFEEEYKRRVVDYMVEGYRSGLTPNPDVMCNREIKFGLFLKAAMRMGADYVATGHYVRLVKRRMRNGESKKNSIHQSPFSFSLFSAKDKTKDQSYFLWTLTQKQLAHCLFPIGDYIKKTEVRALAKKFCLPNAEKKDSQGICFLGKVALTDFLKAYIPERRGVVLAANGEVIGTHRGAGFYTIGQRSGVGVSGLREPHYVFGKDIKKNVVYAAPDGDSMLSKREVTLMGVNAIRPVAVPEKGLSLFARVRYRQPLARAMLTLGKKNSASLRFAKPQKFVAAGQSAVFYSKSGEMLGGGIIV